MVAAGSGAMKTPVALLLGRYLPRRSMDPVPIELRREREGRKSRH
jgi:hypothetical protein